MDRRYRFSGDTAEIDRAKVYHWLSELSFWGKGRSRAEQDTMIDNSWNYGVFDPSGTQVAYARVVTDTVNFAWVCDVFVDPVVRGRGIGVGLMDGVMEHLRSVNMFRVALRTADAHGLYQKSGFALVQDDPSWMSVLLAPDALKSV